MKHLNIASIQNQELNSYSEHVLSALKGLVNEVNSFQIFTHLGWLDDIGLPQYKDQFHEARVDGRMIQYLTVVRLNLACTVTLSIKWKPANTFILHFRHAFKLSYCMNLCTFLKVH